MKCCRHVRKLLYSLDEVRSVSILSKREAAENAPGKEKKTNPTQERHCKVPTYQPRRDTLPHVQVTDPKVLRFSQIQLG